MWPRSHTAFKNLERKVCFVAFICPVMLLMRAIPPLIQLGKGRISIRLKVHGGEIDSSGMGQKKPIDLPSTHDKRLRIALTLRKGIIDRRDHQNPRWDFEARMTRDHDVGPPRKRGRQRVVGLSTHDDRVPACVPFEKVQVVA